MTRAVRSERATRETLELLHSWPLAEQSGRFELGLVLNCAVIDTIEPAEVGALGLHHVGCWECDLSDDSLSWSGGVYDIFGLPRGTRITRGATIALYSERSRAALERLRAHGIRHKRGFTLDLELRPATGGHRWMRLIAAPVCEGGKAVRLHGLKMIV